MSDCTENINTCISRLYKNKAHMAASFISADGTLWTAQIRCGKSLSELTVSPLSAGEASDAASKIFTCRATAISDCQLSCDEADRPLVIWRQIESSGSRIFFAVFKSGKWCDGGTIPAPPGQFAHPQLCRDALGRPWLAMQSTASGRRHIFISWLTGGQWSFAQRISDGDGNCFSPALCSFGSGVRAVWDAQIDGKYGIYMRELDTSAHLAQRESQAIVATSSTLLANATIAALDNESSIIIWEKAQKDWGRRNLVFRGSRIDMTEGNFLMARRELRGAVISPEGIAKLPAGLSKKFDACCESAVRTAPKIATAADGSLWLSFRQTLNLPEAERHSGFSQMLCNYRNGDFCEPSELPDSSGDCDMHAAFSVNADKTLLLNYSGRKKQDYYALSAALPQTGPAGEISLSSKFKTMQVPDFDTAAADTIIWHSGQYNSRRLLFGDIHRHTSLSGCRWWCEGSPRDAYRYAIESAKLDFLALTDHSWDLASEDTRHDLFDSANTYNTPGVFTAFCAYELSLAGGHGHMVVLNPGDNPQIPSAKTRSGLYRSVKGTGAIVIPHHMGDPTYPYKWDGHKDEISPLAEIYQPYRTSFEQAGAPAPPTAWVDEGNAPLEEGMFLNAWKRGYKIGVVASSDHLSTGGAYVGLWANGNTRGDILEALKNRHCYGATDRIELKFSADGNLMGSIFTAETDTVTFDIQCKCPSAVKCVELLAGGEVIKTFKPAKKTSKKLAECFQLKLSAGEEEFYYIRVIQQDKQMAWSSPVWITPA